MDQFGRLYHIFMSLHGVNVGKKHYFWAVFNVEVILNINNMSKQENSFMVVFDKKNKSTIVTVGYTVASRFSGISLYRLHKYEATTPVYENDTHIIYFHVVWAKAQERKGYAGWRKG